jgi:hypothetical protein
MDAIVGELDKLAHQIQNTESRIRDLQRAQDEVNKVMAENNGITDADLQRDRIAQRSVAEVYALWEIHQAYRVNSRNADGKEGYTQDPKYVNMLQQLQQKFVAFAERNPWVLTGVLQLNLLNPGSDNNRTALDNLIGKLRVTAQNDKVKKQVRKYIDSLTRNIDDEFVSRDIYRRQRSKNAPESSNSLLTATETAGATFEYTSNVSWWTDFSGETALGALTKAFKQKVSATYNGRPFCGEPPPTGEEAARDEAQEQKDEAVQEGTEEYQKSLAKNVLSISDLEKTLNINVTWYTISGITRADVHVVAAITGEVLEAEGFQGENSEEVLAEADAYVEQMKQKYAGTYENIIVTRNQIQ